MEDGQELTSEECVRAGMYWFGRSDFTAADAWWQRALEIDPHNTRARECLRLLSKSSITGFSGLAPGPATNDLSIGPPAAELHASSSIENDLVFAPESSSEDMAVLVAGEDGEPSAPIDTGLIDELPNMVLDPSGDLKAKEVEAEPPSGSRDLPPSSDGPQGRGFPFYDDPHPVDRASPTDAFDFAATGQLPRTEAPSTPRKETAAPTSSPWDEGPSRTSVLTLDDDSGSYDALPDHTPLPTVDRERFFGRSEPETHEEIIDYLRATGDLPAMPSPAKPPSDQNILIDEPVEFSGDAPLVSETGTVGMSGLDEGRRRFKLHDFAGAIEVLETIAEDAPEATEARNLIASSRSQMLKMYESKIGDFSRIPRVLISNEQVIWLNLNHRAGFILSQIDGSVTYEDIIALSGMPRLDTVQILSKLLSDGVIGTE
ncbi:MAG: hypothetical protein AAF449_03570 [Myxococcota bacterium]